MCCHICRCKCSLEMRLQVLVTEKVEIGGSGRWTYQHTAADAWSGANKGIACDNGGLSASRSALLERDAKQDGPHRGSAGGGGEPPRTCRHDECHIMLNAHVCGLACCCTSQLPRLIAHWHLLETRSGSMSPCKVESRISSCLPC